MPRQFRPLRQEILDRRRKYLYMIGAEFPVDYSCSKLQE